MLVEIIEAADIRLIAIQYHISDMQMETRMRAENPLFDCKITGMSKEMVKRIESHTHRTAIFELKDKS